jgi:NAD(P)-dependent dehydrogenase (short-subunit alcohol dehydrogenase family)
MSEHPSPSVQQLFNLTGRTALVTGASGHLGFDLASALAEAGAQVIVSSRHLENGQKTAQSLPRHGVGEHHAVEIDHLDETSIEHGFAQAVALTGRIDILINNAHDLLVSDWRSVNAAQFNRQLSNATGYFLLSRWMRDHAVSRSAGASIIMLGSMYGQVASYPEVYEGLGDASPAAYHALKGGLIQLTRHLAVYWAKDRVRVNCLSPGPFPGPGISNDLSARLNARSPMARPGQPHELKGAALFLASDASSYVTGHTLVVDGGWTAW